MNQVTHLAGHCAQCGRRLAADAPEGLCGACLLSAGTETLTYASDELETVRSADAGYVGGPAALDPGAPPGDAPRLEPGQAWGAYRIGRLLGRGGMGEVYEAEHLESGRRVALKVLRSRLRDAEDRARFLREGQLAASISHPHTVYIFGSEDIGGTPVISMELLPGGTLKDRVAVGGPLPPADAVAAVLEIIGGLDAAQASGILHRDIKPSNCFVDADGTVKVGDFGLSISTLARDVHHDLETTGFQGTPAFAPPEQLRGEPLDMRADIYAVGATLYYLLTGAPPFEARDLRELAARITSEPARSPRRLRPGIPPGLAAVVLRCLAKTPAERPESYAALAEALHPYATQDHAAAPPGLRVWAGAIDYALIAFAASVWKMWVNDPLTGERAFQLSDDVITAVVTAAYYLVLEGGWDASLGKRVFGLRVARRSGRRAGWLRIAARIAVYLAPGAVAGVLFDVSRPGGATFAGFGLLALLFFTMRRDNGWAAVHDLASGTRVLAPASSAARRRAALPRQSPAAPLHAHRRLGPFVVLGDGTTMTGNRLLTGFDPVLRRHVWIQMAPAGAPPVPAARRDLSRVARLHWLAGRRTDGEAWDAYEAPEGVPLLARDVVDWSALKGWLLDLGRELMAAAEDRTTPPLALDRLWSRHDGRLVLLDFRAPGLPLADTAALLTPVELLAAVAGHARGHGIDRPDAPPALPLSARQMLERWAGAAPPSIADAWTELMRAAAGPDQVWRARRAVPVAIAAVPFALVVALSLLLVPTIYRFMNPQNTQILTMLDGLSQANPRPESGLRDPEYRAAVERYLVGRHGERLRSDAFWNQPVMQGRLGAMRVTANAVLARHPAVTAEETAAAERTIAPTIAFARRQAPASLGAVLGLIGIIIAALAAFAAAIVAAGSIVSALLVPGGIGMRLLGVAVVSRDGVPIGRLRSAGRALLTWLPVLVWLGGLAAAPRIQGFVPNPPYPLALASIALGVMAAGAAWAVARPARGLQDRLAGTWLLPR